MYFCPIWRRDYVNECVLFLNNDPRRAHQALASRREAACFQHFKFRLYEGRAYSIVRMLGTFTFPLCNHGTPWAFDTKL